MYPAPAQVVERVLSRIEISESGCWIWPGATSSGYGRIAWSNEGRMRWGAVHRVMYAAEHGPIPDGLDIDHQCHDPASCRPSRAVDCLHRRCCNPAHLSAMTRRENLLRGGTIPSERAAITACPQGHPYDEANTMTDKRGRRTCRACTYERNRAYYWANKDKRRAYNAAWRAKRRNDDAQ